ncbi:MAG TPA: hypothetical protein EYG57_17505 [Planctomycetes bacterium]|nr:hypothetical protein [Planctomycetota bacterium]
MKRITFVVLVTCFAAHSMAVATAPAVQVSSVRQVVAHRGASTERPECTLAAIQRSIDVGATAVEIDIRTSKDGRLFVLHDETLDRTTNGQGRASERTMAELKKLDAGSWFDAKYKDERIPTLRESLELCRGKIDLLLDLKEKGATYVETVVREIREYGNPKRTIIGVRSVAQAEQFRKLLPTSRQLGLIPVPQQIDAFAKAGVETIRLWPNWLADDSLVAQIRRHKVQLHLNGTTGKPPEVLMLLRHKPYSLSADDPATLIATLDEWKRSQATLSALDDLVTSASDATMIPWVSRPGSSTFLNRDYEMVVLPQALHDQPRYIFDGGSGDRIVMKFGKPAVVFAAFEYNDTGAWSFPAGRTPLDLGWRLLTQNGYRGTSNGNLGDKPHFASIYYCEYDGGEQLSGLPAWWLCLAIVDPASAAKIPGFRRGTSGPIAISPTFSYEGWSTGERPLDVPQFESRKQWNAWQESRRESFVQRLVFPYDEKAVVATEGNVVDRGKFVQQELSVTVGGRRIFRFYRLAPKSATGATGKLPTIVCFMGHGKVQQLLTDRDSYQHACAAQFAERGYLVFAMENVGMEPNGDTHHELDRLLRLDGYCWYSLLFAHQQILMRHIFSENQVDPQRVGVTGVSTGGLLALSAAACEPRITAASVQGIFGSMRISFIHDRDRHCRCGAIPGLLPLFDLPELALLVTPRPIHISNAVNDGFGPLEAKRCLNRIASLYQQAGGPRPEFSEPPGRHEFAFEPALMFFQRTIGKPTNVH